MVVKSPRSGVNFFDLGSFDEHMEAARRRARPRLATLMPSLRGSRGSSSSGIRNELGSVQLNGNGVLVEGAAVVAAANESVVRATSV